ncbi:hypothetical protein NOF04DRAFT_19225 [Fusarium oxysporum II5]|uniref:Uncharacterized protein n=2 Tax=Fusarium oxysporum species complex TaxID=171631 RepID=X0K9F8_FUSO5|nr:uncharacterized protein FOIG_05242 [Fusarium odoratissimum NRRL 54006]EXM05266.1 hypothetical protein FOIG_05242 [Fusarium odoratissimum NRRL 54006]KAK2127090.1 hypothetical protein NOF04DRAFT_19225 [Fusarium oxysporum II5]TXB98485.1 hypothetical protein FocTR4_00012960 [Fusarium oxysporum f. sp. cubense]
MAETSVDEAEKCSLNRRKNDTASAKEQSMKALDSDYWTKTKTGLEATDDGQRRASQGLKGEDWCIFSGGAEGQVSWFKETDNALPLLGCGEGEALGPGGPASTSGAREGTLDKGTIA